MDILNLENAPLSDRNGSYGGAAGSKEGILIDDQYWIVKYPQSTRSMRGDLTSYTSSPLSEYIGSHIYQILGYPVHDTMLGLRNGKIVIACKDFCTCSGELREIRTLKNTYNKTLEDLLEREMVSTGDGHAVDLKEILLHMDYNPILRNIPGLKERFWNMVIIDGLINNNDRNNGNWGLLYRNGAFQIAPIYDNGASFSNKASDNTLAARLADPQKMEASALNTISAYSKGGRNYTFKTLLKESLAVSECRKAVKCNTALLQEKWPEIRCFVEQIPESYHDVLICSAVRKAVYLQDMRLRYEKLLLPALEKIAEMEAGKNSAEKTELLYEH